MRIYNYTGDSLTVGNIDIDAVAITAHKDLPIKYQGETLDLTKDIAFIYRTGTGVQVEEISHIPNLWPWVILFNVFGFFALTIKLVQKLKQAR